MIVRSPIIPINRHHKHCIALHCIALHCIALHCIALHCIALHCTALHCTALHCTALHCTALHCTALHCTALHCIIASIQCKMLSNVTFLQTTEGRNPVLFAECCKFSVVICGVVFQFIYTKSHDTNHII